MLVAAFVACPPKAHRIQFIHKQVLCIIQVQMYRVNNKPKLQHLLAFITNLSPPAAS